MSAQPETTSTGPGHAPDGGNAMDRRTVLRAAGVSGAGVAGAAALAACGGSTTPTTNVPSTTTSSSTSSSGSSTSSTSSTDSSTSASATGSASAAAPSGTPVKTADVPVGGGVINASGLFVVTQPSAGQFKAFSAVCTHQGCTVNKVASGMIDCPCHMSQFDISTGTPTSSSQAKSPLPAKTATVSGDSVYIA
jgi:Rieske Fe-S protein